MSKNSTKTTVEHRQIEAGCEDSAFIVAGCFVDAMLVRLAGETVATDDIDLICEHIRLHLSGNAPTYMIGPVVKTTILAKYVKIAEPILMNTDFMSIVKIEAPRPRYRSSALRFVSR